MQRLTQKFLIYLTLAAAPLYLIKLTFFSLPTNLFECLLLLNVAAWIWHERKEKFKSLWKPLPWQIILSLGLILGGTLCSIMTNDARIIGFGILKSWFVLPLIFTYILANTLENNTELEKGFLSIYFSIELIAFISLLYKLYGVLTYDGRLSGFYVSPNYLALYLAPGSLLGFYFLLKSFEKKSSTFVKILASLSLMIILLTLFYTYSYAAWIAVFLSATLTALFYLQKKKFFLLSLGLTVLFSFAALSQLNSQKFSSLIHFSQRSSLSSRIMIWKATEKMLLQNPILGIGPGNFQVKYLSLQAYFPPYLEWAVPQPHNVFLAFWLQSGLIGLVGFLLLLSFIFYQLLKKNQLKKISPELLLFSFFLYIILHGLVDTPFWKNDLSFLFWVYLGFFLVLSRNAQKIK